jgi:hypothetical protein
VSVVGIPVPAFGLYSISLQLDGMHVGDRSFRMVKGF